jgi:cytosine permease
VRKHDHIVIRRGGRPPPDSRPVHWPAIIAWACGFAAAQFLPGIAPLNTILASSAAYLLLARRHTGCS